MYCLNTSDVGLMLYTMFPTRSCRVILQSIEEELRPRDANSKTSCSSETKPPAGPVVAVASTAVSEPKDEAGDPNTHTRSTPSTTAGSSLPASRGKHAKPKHFQRPRFQSTRASRARRKNQVAIRRFCASSRCAESIRLDRAGLAMGADAGTRSVGTVVAHFPTAVSTMLTARRRKATKKAWG